MRAHELAQIEEGEDAAVGNRQHTGQKSLQESHYRLLILFDLLVMSKVFL